MSLSLFVLLPIAASVYAPPEELKPLLGDVADVFKNIATLKHGIKDLNPNDAPQPDMLDDGKQYLPAGAGCTSQPEWAKTAPKDTHAIEFNVTGWNGFCQYGFTICPDAVANKDYSYYWRGLSTNWAKVVGKIDGQYCKMNGWLKPEYRSIANDFEALTRKGQEECDTRWSKPEYGLESAKLNGVEEVEKEALRYDITAALNSGFLVPMKNHEQVSLRKGLKTTIDHLLDDNLANLMMQRRTASTAAA